MSTNKIGLHDTAPLESSLGLPRVSVEFQDEDHSLFNGQTGGGEDGNVNKNGDDDGSSLSSFHSSGLGSSNPDSNSSSGGGPGSGSRKKKSPQDMIAAEEHKAVNRARAFMVIFLVSGAGLMAQAAYFFVHFGEINSFHDAYGDQSKTVQSAMTYELSSTLAVIDSFMNAIQSDNEAAIAAAATTTGSSSSEQMDWPFVEIPDFGVRAAKILSLSRASVLTVYPKVEAGQQRVEWETWAREHDNWIGESLEVQRNDPTYAGRQASSWTPSNSIFNFQGPLPREAPGPHYPMFYASPIAPIPSREVYNFDLYDDSAKELQQMHDNGVVILGRTRNLADPNDPVQMQEQEATIGWMTDLLGPDVQGITEPMITINYPIIQKSNERVIASPNALNDGYQHSVVGTITVTLLWQELLQDLLSPGSNGIVVVIGNECGTAFTYQLNGPIATFLGRGDLHDQEYDENDDLNTAAYLHDLIQNGTSGATYTGAPLDTELCPYWVKTYASDEMREDYETIMPLLFLSLTILIFLFAFCVFKIYDWVSERRTKKIMRVAAQSSAVVASLFPKVVRDRLFAPPPKKADTKRDSIFVENAKMRVQKFLGEGTTRGASSRHGRNHDLSDGNEDSMSTGDRQQQNEAQAAVANAPIAELFTDTTVMFADIAGFTAWSSVREPAQVFILLESLYGAYDKIAKRRGVFKVETIGDCYMAVTGLPEPRRDHALAMCKFARDIRDKTTELTLKLARTLGPDTDDLALRIGLNSGAVTAGVLRGEKSRFQLFGDTVNTASRMESTGVVNKIHVSPSTAELLKKAGKSHWLSRREDAIEAKGKGLIQTFWVEPHTRVGGSNASTASSFSDELEDDFEQLDEKTMRLVDWNVEIMAKLIRQIVARREAWDSLTRRGILSRRHSVLPPHGASLSKDSVGSMGSSQGTVLEEVQEVVELPEFDPRLAQNRIDPSTIQLDEMVMTQLKEFVSIIAVMYRANPFHCFEHASHVTMSVTKLLSRIVAPTDDIIQTTQDGKAPLASTLHDHTYGITSDPLTQFACVFSALIHDVDHQGVPNAQLIKEGSPLDAIYKGKSLAEQNSVDLSWKLLMEDQFEELRNIICHTPGEMTHFRHLVVNSVMATDIMDKDLKTLRNQRWDKAFSEGSRLGETSQVNTNRKATIVIEHLIQASDVSHTMQHWHIYRKWNEKLFHELYLAYKAGRAEKNPADFWYKGEMGFFDFYIIPLAKKLSDCGVFGVSSDEYLSYAMKNREEWENRGQEVVSSMIKKFEETEEKLPGDESDLLS
eukprot:CAMPEP_0172460140 /NCGR_PEP_ID=MMETSP1065-20121228/35696_1 /TAXON_ID=265537 /ORGANISM="Amphiprora paludosa, Strain CCMP125" /LENGTH=1281 /DNA_ID=CAMNT_0013215079 /DNA_START=46 /DNA_END=3891 /DNA_ORIENTATION=-